MQTPIQRRSRSTHVQLASWKGQVSKQFASRVADMLPAYYYIEAEKLSQELALNGASVPDLTRTKNVNPSNTKLLVIDCRRPDRYTASHLPGALNIHTIILRRICRHLRNVDKQTRIVVYSDTGLRADFMAILLRIKGFKDTLVLKKGYSGWEKQRKPVEHCVRNLQMSQ